MVPVERSVTGNVTVWPETFVAVDIPGMAVAPSGRSLVVVVQFEAEELTVMPVGNITCKELSVPADSGVAQIVPPVEELTFNLSSFTMAPRFPAFACLLDINVRSNTKNNKRAIHLRINCLYMVSSI